MRIAVDVARKQFGNSEEERPPLKAVTNGLLKTQESEKA
jgi:hypothetical protein